MNTAPILLVEDEPNSAFFFKHIAGAIGIANPVHVASDGQQAIDYLEGVGEFSDRDKHPLPGLVVLDLKLPRMTGFDVLRSIRANPRVQQLIVVMLTSSASDADIREAYELGANAYLVKPSRLEELTKIVQSLKDFWLTYNCAPPLSDG